MRMPSSAQGKPNILLILTDDQRFNTIHALGNPEIQTPNLDRLAAEGAAFTHAHIPGGTSGAVCMPSRAMLHSGVTLFHLYEAGSAIPREHTTLGQCFREQGYTTIGIGKWHNGTESYARSFTDGDNIFFGGMWDHWNVPVCSFHPDGRYENKIQVIPNFQHANHPMELIAERIRPGVHSTELLTESALSFLRQEQDREQPFLLSLAYLAPHDPRSMPERFRNMYDPEKLQLPPNFTEEHPFPIGINASIGEDRDENLAAHPRSGQEVRRHIADYYAMISHLDENIGKLLDCLEETGQRENTIVVFTGDNGLSVGCHGLMGKQSLYEDSIRVPLILSGPGIPKGERRDDYVYLLDIYPTLCDLAGLPAPASVEGQSFRPALEGRGQARADLYFAYTHLIRGVKDRRRKLLCYRLHPEENQLFDLEADPWEMHNLYGDPACAAVRQRLEKRLLEYKAQWETPSSPFTRQFWQE